MALESSPYDSSFSEEEMNTYNAMLGKRWVRVDPETRQPHDHSRDFFWQIAHMYPAVKSGGDMNSPKMRFLVQRYYRNRTYEANLDQSGLGKTTRHEAFHEVNEKGELIRPGYITVDYDAFLKQFAEDGALPPAREQKTRQTAKA